MPLAATTIAVALFLYSRRFAGVPETRYFQTLTMLTAAWSLFQTVDLLLTGLEEKLVMMQLKFVVAPFVCVVVFALLTEHSGRGSWLTRRNAILVSMVPFITMLMAFTVQFHDLMLYDFSVSDGSPAILMSTAGPWYWIYLAYAYGIMFASIMLLIDSARGANPLYRKQAMVLLLAFLPPALFDIMDNYHFFPTQGLELAPASFALSGAVVAWGLFRYRILDVRPIARSEVVENMTDVMLVVDPEGRLIDYNRAAGTFLSRHPKTVLGLPLREGFPFGRDLEGLLKERSGRGEVSLGEGADRRAFEASIMPVEVNGELRARMVLLRDITERKRVEEALHAANARLGLLSSMTRHDLLNKLTVIDGYVALARQEKDLDRAKTFLGKLDLASDAARSLITFTKDYEGVGIKAPSWNKVDEVFARAAGQLPMENITVTTSADGLLIYSDAMIEKVFYNLLDNSLRHGGNVSNISLTCRESADCLVISYRDDGRGIGERDKARIFERGFGKNTGLGLYLVREVLAITGIEIAETGEPGKEARFNMKVPRGGYRFSSAADQASPAAPAASDPPPVVGE